MKNAKLQLTKRTIANLDRTQMLEVRGGVARLDEASSETRCCNSNSYTSSTTECCNCSGLQ